MDRKQKMRYLEAIEGVKKSEIHFRGATDDCKTTTEYSCATETTTKATCTKPPVTLPTCEPETTTTERVTTISTTSGDIHFTFTIDFETPPEVTDHEPNAPKGFLPKDFPNAPIFDSNEAVSNPSNYSNLDLDSNYAVTITIDKNGEKCSCIRVYAPVCGSDGNSYFNRCALYCQHDMDLTIVHDGNCIPFK